jgi:hypothetical protein
VQTPQAFGLGALRSAYDRWTGDAPTDETSVARAAGLSVAAVDGDPLLDKLTTAADWDRAEAMLAARLVSRAGMGFDVHGFSGDGPLMLECKTYRLRRHAKSDRNLYRTRDEIEAWRQRDPIVRLESEALAHGRLSSADIATIAKEARATLDRALEFAKASPEPDAAELLRDVYA